MQAGFGHRRKTLVNSLVLGGFDRPAVDAALAAAGIDPGVRAEALEPETFVDLAEALA